MIRATVVLAALLAAFVPSISAPAAPAAPAHSAPSVAGALTQLSGGKGCLVSSTTSGCSDVGATAPSTNLAVSPNGKFVATADEQYDAVVLWKRGADGSLIFLHCADPSATLGYTPHQHSCLTDPNLSDVWDLVFSGDDRSLFVASFDGGFGSLSNYDINPGSGAMTHNTTTPCINTDGSNGCTKSAAIESADAVAQDPKRNRVFVGGDKAIVAFNRNSARGLTTYGCIDDDGSDGCTKSPSIDGVDAIAVDTPGSRVWVASRDAGSVVGLSDTANPVLSVQQCFWASANEGHCSKTPAVSAPSGITIGPKSGNQRSIYVTDYNRNVLDEFTTSGSGGGAAYAGCRSFTGGVGSVNGICVQDYRLEEPQGVAVSSDGKNVYIASDRSNPPQGSQLLAAYSRNRSTGEISPLKNPYSCVKASGVTGDCAVGRGMYDPNGVAVSPNGASVYLADRGGDSTLIFSREVAPVCMSVTSHSHQDKKVTVNLKCSDVNGDSLKITVGKAHHGKLGKVSHGKVSFTPTQRFGGTATFTVKASDGGLSSSPVTDKVIATKSHAKKHH